MLAIEARTARAAMMKPSMVAATDARVDATAAAAETAALSFSPDRSARF
jgi:hypothetical protein